MFYVVALEKITMKNQFLPTSIAIILNLLLPPIAHLPSAGGDADDEEPLLLFASITLDRVLTEPDSGAATIIPGKESRAVLNHVHQWMSSLGSDRIIKENLAQALGTDIEGRSRLITRYITPQEPPTDVVGDVLNDPYAIEKCARYVSLITFLTDAQMFEGRAVDLWCTSKTFLDIGCGDYEEHAILLCNYFNFIDGKRGEVSPSTFMSCILRWCSN